jgi:hypothetical protein
MLDSPFIPRHLGTRSRVRAGVAALLAAAFAWPAAAHGDAVTDWNSHANAAIFSTGPTAHAASISTAMVHGAVYDAVNAIAGGHRPYLPTPRADRTYSQDAAAATAAFKVTAALVPSQLAVLEARYADSLAAIPAGPAKTGGIAVGADAANAMLDKRANDGRNGPFTFELGTAPGAWRPSPPLFALDPAPWVGNVTPFLIPSADRVRSDGPNALTSRAYARDFNEVKALGSLTSPHRTADQTRAAIFWQAQPGALYGGVMRSLSARYELSTAENARLFAMVTLAAADGAIACWKDKYDWKFWRPIDAIHGAASDGNPATTADTGWRPLFDPSTATVPALSTPSFPEHPSGHTCTSGATVHALGHFFGTDTIAFDVVSSRFPGQARHFERFSDALEEVVDARVWGGIHFRTADVQGAVMGKKIARWERRHYFQPVD